MVHVFPFAKNIFNCKCCLEGMAYNVFCYLSLDHMSPPGYHQKCHTPPIPASALELDTPWNCSYCLKGVKCPYLTESLDVLQNLLSDEECQSHDDMDSVTTAESDEGGEEFTEPAVQRGNFLAPPKPHKKRVYKSFLLCI